MNFDLYQEESNIMSNSDTYDYIICGYKSFSQGQ